MNRSILVAAAAALAVVLAGCVGIRAGPPETITLGKKTITLAGLEGFNASEVRRPDPHNPNVFVTARDTIVVDQEPVRPERPIGGTIYLAWALDSASDYSFPDDNAVIFLPGETNPLPSNLACKLRLPRKKVIVCAYDKPERPAQWKYTIRVVDRAGRELAKLDPWIYQD